MQGDGSMHGRARKEGGGLGEDRVGGTGDSHTACAELPRRAAAQEQVLRRHLVTIWSFMDNWTYISLMFRIHKNNLLF